MRKLSIGILLLILAGFFLACMSGCTPQKRLERLLHKHPELAVHDTTVSIQRDTISGTDLLFDFENKCDTIIKNDTIIQVKDGTAVKIIRTEKKIYVEVEKPPVIITHTVIQTSMNINCPPCEVPMIYRVLSWTNLFWLLVVALILWIYEMGKK